MINDPAVQLEAMSRLGAARSEYLSAVFDILEHVHPFGAEYQFTIASSRDCSRIDGGWTFNRYSHDFGDAEIQFDRRIQSLLALVESTWRDLPAVVEPEKSLTARELEVLSAVARGLTAAAIGAHLGIQRATVTKHLEHIYRKLDCGDRLVAVDRARRLGLLF